MSGKNVISGPVTLRALMWAERTIVTDPGTDDQQAYVKRSTETFLITATSFEELTRAFLEAAKLKSHDQLFLKGRKIKTTKS